MSNDPVNPRDPRDLNGPKDTPATATAEAAAGPDTLKDRDRDRDREKVKRSPIAESAIRKIAGHYKMTPATLAAYLDPEWIPTKYLMMISLKIAQAISRGGGRLIISVPPRHGKSRLGSIGTSVWALENFPTKKVIITAYGSDLATEFSGPVRDIIADHPDKLSVRIRRDSNRLDKFNTTRGGGLRAVGLGGPITGRGADVLFVDDYIKEIKDAESATARDYIWNWFTTTAMTRLEPNATVIIIATRWHKDDLIGRLLKEQAEEWDYIKLPALAEPNDPMGREVGEALFPERYSREDLLKTKALLGSHYFASLYQQDPKSGEFAVTDRDWFQKITPKAIPNYNHLKIGRIWDLAGTQNAGDYTVGALIAADIRFKFPLVYVLSIIRDQLGPSQVEILVRNTAEADGQGVPIFIEQEPGGSGKSQIQHYKSKVLPDFKVTGCPTTKAKLLRAQPMLAGAEAGRIFILQGGWNETFLDEIELFPEGDHDDQCDVLAIGWEKLVGKEISTLTWGRTISKNQEGTIDNIEDVINTAEYHAKPNVVWGRSGKSNNGSGKVRQQIPRARVSGIIW